MLGLSVDLKVRYLGVKRREVLFDDIGQLRDFDRSVVEDCFSLCELCQLFQLAHSSSDTSSNLSGIAREFGSRRSSASCRVTVCLAFLGIGQKGLALGASFVRSVALLRLGEDRPELGCPVLYRGGNHLERDVMLVESRKEEDVRGGCESREKRLLFEQWAHCPRAQV
jgi:hypothetical protein